MGDVVPTDVRSRMMAGIRGKDTKPELQLRQLLHRDGFRYRLHDKSLPGRPDLVFPRWRAVVQVHGCFWHAHEGCKYFKMPSTRRDFWTAKLNGNRQRDLRNDQLLRDAGWSTAVVWECALRSDPNAAADAVISWLRECDRSSLVVTD